MPPARELSETGASAAWVAWTRRPVRPSVYVPRGRGHYGPAPGWDGQMPPQQTCISQPSAGQLGWDDDDAWDDGPGYLPPGGSDWDGSPGEIGGGQAQLGR